MKEQLENYNLSIDQNQYIKLPNNRQQQQPNQQTSYLSQPQYIFGNNIFSMFFASWITPIVQFGYQKPITNKFIPQLKEDDKIYRKYQKFKQIFYEISKEGQYRPGLILFKTLMKYQLKQQLVFIFLNIIVLICRISILLFNQQLIKYIEGQKTTISNIKHLLIYAGLVGFDMFSWFLIFYYYNLKDKDLSYILSLMIYDKVLRYPFISSKRFELAQIVNLSQTDAYRCKWLHYQFSIVSYSSLYVIVCIWIVFYYIGYITLVCVAILITVVFFSFILFQIVSDKQTQFYIAKDKTVKVAQQILDMINFIKFNVLEKYFLNKISNKKQQQLLSLSDLCLLKTFINFIFSLFSPIMVIILFLLYVKFYQQHITTPLAFLVLTIFTNIQALAQDFPEWLSHLIVVWVSAKRIQNFLLATQINKNHSTKIQAQKSTEYAIQLKNVDLFWEQHKEYIEIQDQIMQQCNKIETDPEQSKKQSYKKKVFQNLNLNFLFGKLTIIFGKVGCGKTSILQGILNQMILQNKQNMKMIISGSISYTSQKAWLFKGSIKQNIIFFSPYDEIRFKQALYYSCLEQDLKILQGGVETQIGQKGVNLSGGQKARVALARALYSNKDIYLFDDVLSALDIHVTNFIIQNTFKYYLKQKTIIITTHDKKLVPYGDCIYKIRNGQIKMIKSDQKQFNEKMFDSPKKLRRNFSLQNKQSFDEKLQNNKFNFKKHNQSSNQGELILPQQQLTGDIKSEIYKQLLLLQGNKIYVIAILIFFTLWSFLTYFANQQIQIWCDDADKSKLYLYLYIGFVVTAGILFIIACYLIQTCQINKNRNLFSKIMHSIIYGSIPQFFNRVPTGRVLNRITNDLSDIDLLNFHQLKPALISLFSIISCFIGWVFTSSILFLIPIVILIIILILFFRFFIKTQQQCLRLEKISNSHIINGITQTLNGLDVIRAFQKTSYMVQNQVRKIEETRSISITRISLQHWSLIRYGLMSYITIFCIVSYCIFNNQKSGAQLGLILIYAITFSEQISYIFPLCTQIRQRMIQFQRIHDLCLVEPELGYKTTKIQSLNPHLKKQNNNKNLVTLEFVNYSAKYREDLPLCLKKINIKMTLGRKIGIVGRTGAGKTSLFNSILRIIQPAQGYLYINQKQIKDYSADQLRNSIITIQQNPTIIDGTIRENIDPNNQYTDTEITNKLQQTNLSSLIDNKGGLDRKISNKNTSAGQKQLINISRALFKKCNIVLMDQATASINAQLNQTIHNIVYEHFKQSTVLIIAHKLSTLQHCDQIIVLKQGQIIQSGETKQLLANDESLYKKMVENNDKLFLA